MCRKIQPSSQRFKYVLSAQLPTESYQSSCMGEDCKQAPYYFTGFIEENHFMSMKSNSVANSIINIIIQKKGYYIFHLHLFQSTQTLRTEGMCYCLMPNQNQTVF